MLSLSFLTFITLTLACIASALPAHHGRLQKRAKAQLITKCTVPNTVALTFVSTLPVPAVQVDNSGVFLFLFFRMMVLMSTCELSRKRKMESHSDPPPASLRYNVSQTLLDAGAKGTFFFSASSFPLYSVILSLTPAPLDGDNCKLAFLRKKKTGGGGLIPFLFQGIASTTKRNPSVSSTRTTWAINLPPTHGATPT